MLIFLPNLQWFSLILHLLSREPHSLGVLVRVQRRLLRRRIARSLPWWDLLRNNLINPQPASKHAVLARPEQLRAALRVLRGAIESIARLLIPARPVRATKIMGVALQR